MSLTLWEELLRASAIEASQVIQEKLNNTLAFIQIFSQLGRVSKLELSANC